MRTRLPQRVILVVLLLAVAGSAVAVHITTTRGLHNRRADRVQTARDRIRDSLERRIYFLEDIADMVGVHDDAAAEEFSRYAHVRGRNETAVVSVQWVRHSPNGKLVPPDAADPNPGRTPMLIAPDARASGALADAGHQRAAAQAIRLASLSKTVSASPPVRLDNGRPAFYLAVPVQARRYTGLLSKAESQSAIVGLVDASAFVAQAFGGGSPGFRLRDRVTPLAASGSALHNALRAALPAAGRRWSIAIDGGSLSTVQIALPWLILVFGFSLAAAVAAILGNSARRRDEALRLAARRLDDLTVSLERVEVANEELEVAHAEAEMRSRIDALTEIFNRRHFREVLDKQLSNPQGTRPAILMLDIDHFKQINDEHGHQMGDVILRAVAGRIASTLRSTDCLARWGGEEFAILAPKMGIDSMLELAERTRRALSDNPVVVDGKHFHLRASIGAALAGDGLDDPDAAIAAADQALYEAKRAGRDCVRRYVPPAGVTRP